MTARRLLSLSALATCVSIITACERATEPSNRQIQLAFTRRALEASRLPPGNYRSVVDTVVLTALSGGAILSAQRRVLADEDTAAVFDIDVNAGVVDFDARVVSNNGTLLFTARQSVNLSASSGTIVIVPQAVNAVLVARTDYTIADNGQVRLFATRIYNSGDRGVDWFILDTRVPPCNSTAVFCAFSPRGGFVQPGGFDSLTIGMPSGTPRPPPIVLSSVVGTIQMP